MNDIFSQPIDRDALNLSRAIALKESGGKADILGDNDTAAGIGQWSNQLNGTPTALSKGQIPANFRASAQTYGLNPDDFSQENQEKVLYAEVKHKKDSGWSPAQIAAAHNAGDKRALDGSWQQNVGTTTINGKQIHYDTPGYVQAVKDYYDQLSGTQPSQQQPDGYITEPSLPTPTPEEQKAAQQAESEKTGLGAEIGGRIKDLSSAASLGAQGVQEGFQGKGYEATKDVASGLLQAGGAVAGGVGDVVNAGLELIPGVKFLESKAGQALQALAGTQQGQQVVQAVQQAAQEHPTLAKDIGAAVNIASVIPMFKGIGLVADAAKTAGAQAAKGLLEKSVAKELTGVANQTISGTKLIENASARGIDPVQVAIKEGALPDVVKSANGTPRYSTKDAFTTLGKSISKDEDNLQGMLDTASSKGLTGYVSLNDLKNEDIARVKKAFATQGNAEAAAKKVEGIYNDYIQSFGDLVPLNKLNEMKRGIRTGIKWNNPDVLDNDIRYHIGDTFKDTIENTAQKLGMPDVAALNQEMGQKLEAQKLMKLLHGKQVKLGSFGKATKGFMGDVAGGVGEFVGGLTQTPIIGALTGRALGRGLAGDTEGTALKLLRRAHKGGSARGTARGLRGIATPAVLRTRETQSKQ